MLTAEGCAKDVKNCLFRGDFEALDKCVSRYRQEGPSDPLLEQLAEALCRNSFGLFAFRLFSNDKNEIHRESLRRQVKLLSFFRLPQQLALMDLEMYANDWCVEHVAVLDTVSPVRGKVGVQVMELLGVEKFDCATALLEKFGVDLRAPTTQMRMHYKRKNSYGMYSVELKRPLPLFAMALLHPSPAQLDYLLSKGIGLEELSSACEIALVLKKEPWQAEQMHTYSNVIFPSLRADLERRLLGQATADQEEGQPLLKRKM